MASSGLKSVVYIYIHTYTVYIQILYRFPAIRFLHCITAIKQKDEGGQGVKLKKSNRAPTNTKTLEKESNAMQIL